MFSLDLTAVSALCSVPRCTAAVIVPHSGNSSQGAAVIVVNSAAHSAVCCGPSHHLHTPSVAFSPAPAPADGGVVQRVQSTSSGSVVCALCSVMCSVALKLCSSLTSPQVSPVYRGLSSAPPLTSGAFTQIKQINQIIWKLSPPALDI